MNNICPECGGDEFHPCEFCRADQEPLVILSGVTTNEKLALRAEIAALKQENEALRTRLRLSEENVRPITPPGYSKYTTEAEWTAAKLAAGIL